MHKIHMKLLYLVHKNIKKRQKKPPGTGAGTRYLHAAAVFFVCKKMNFQAHGKMI